MIDSQGTATDEVSRCVTLSVLWSVSCRGLLLNIIISFFINTKIQKKCFHDPPPRRQLRRKE
jgi:uncharacterized protein YneF (UPF0154 family)